jgi:hypothetical protein
MDSLKRLGLAQRIAILVGLGLAIEALGSYIVSLGGPFGNFGSFGFAPLTNNSFISAGGSLSAWEQLLIWLGLIAVWSGVALWLLGPTPAEPDPDA